MVEQALAGWTEESLGLKLLQLIKDMKSHLKRQRLKHYFISSENMFDLVPKHKLAQAHERFYRFQVGLTYLRNLVKNVILKASEKNKNKISQNILPVCASSSPRKICLTNSNFYP